MSFLIYHKDHQHHRHDRYLFYNYFSSILFLSLLLLLRDDFALYYLVFFLFFFPLVCLVLVYCMFFFHLLFLFAFLHIISRILKQWVGSVEITLMNEHLEYVSYSFALIGYVILLQTNNFTLELNKTYIQQDSSLQVCWSFTFYLLNF